MSSMSRNSSSKIEHKYTYSFEEGNGELPHYDIEILAEQLPVARPSSKNSPGHVVDVDDSFIIDDEESTASISIACSSSGSSRSSRSSLSLSSSKSKQSASRQDSSLAVYVPTAAELSAAASIAASSSAVYVPTVAELNATSVGASPSVACRSDVDPSHGVGAAVPTQPVPTPAPAEPRAVVAAKSAASAAAKAVHAAATSDAAKLAGDAAVRHATSRLPAPAAMVAREAAKSARRSLVVNTASATPEKPTPAKLQFDVDSPSTPSTVAMSPGSSPASSPASSPTSTVHTIEIVNKTKKDRSIVCCFLLFFQKKYLVAGIVLAVFAFAIYLLSEYLGVPGLHEQIRELEREVDDLKEQVDRLEKENDRFEELNDELEENNEEYSTQNDRLERSNAFYEELNNQLNSSNAELMNLNEILNSSNVEYSRLNKQLTNTIEDLNGQVDLLESVNSNLTSTLMEYIKINQGLSTETDNLDRLNADLSNNLMELSNALTELRLENDRLVGLLDDLGAIASFLNETSIGLEQSYEYIASYLAEQIVANRAILSETLHNTFRQQTINWVCGLSIQFATEAFVTNGTLPIGSDAYPQVIGYIESNVFSVLCLDTDDFEAYLAKSMGDKTISPTSASLNTLIMSVMTYSSEALNYYFPDSGEAGGLTSDVWAQASFRCVNLPEEYKFIHSAS